VSTRREEFYSNPSAKTTSRYFAKFENYTADERYPHVDMTVKGSGPVTVGYNTFFADSSKDWVETCKNLKIPFSADFNTTGGTRGVNRVCPLVTLVSPVNIDVCFSRSVSCSLTFAFTSFKNHSDLRRRERGTSNL